MPRLKLAHSLDGEGDACVLLQIFDDKGTHIRYATEDELKGFLHSVDPTLTDDSEMLEVPDEIGICVTCGKECYPDGQCEDACRECGEHYEDGGDGYDGMCPSCADKAEHENGVCDKCGKTDVEIARTDDDGDLICVDCDENEEEEDDDAGDEKTEG